MASTKLSRLQRKAIEEGKIVETTNALDYDEFCYRHLSSHDLEDVQIRITERYGRDLAIQLKFAETLKHHSKDMLDACFRLIEDSSSDDYRSSEMGWSPTNKRREMVLPDMRYLIVSESSQTNDAATTKSSASNILGFVSFMITYEDGREVIYVYEIHLASKLRGRGIGRVLMSVVEGIGRKVGVEKCMLTVFTSNTKAVRWYERAGYTVDEFSPGPRVLRNGAVKQPSYLVLSRHM